MRFPAAKQFRRKPPRAYFPHLGQPEGSATHTPTRTKAPLPLPPETPWHLRRERTTAWLDAHRRSRSRGAVEAAPRDYAHTQTDAQAQQKGPATSDGRPTVLPAARTAERNSTAKPGPPRGPWLKNNDNRGASRTLAETGSPGDALYGPFCSCLFVCWVFFVVSRGAFAGCAASELERNTARLQMRGFCAIACVPGRG